MDIIEIIKIIISKETIMEMVIIIMETTIEIMDIKIIENQMIKESIRKLIILLLLILLRRKMLLNILIELLINKKVIVNLKNKSLENNLKRKIEIMKKLVLEN